MNKLLFLILGTILFITTSCGNDATNAEIDKDKNLLVHYWELAEAQRNGKKTESMVDAYLDFSKEGNLMINLDGTAQNAKWELKNKAINISGTKNSALSTEYTIKELTDSTLTVELEMRETPFLLQFVKAEKE